MAGIYNKLNDGFLTCTLLISNFCSNTNQIPHIGKQRPLTFKTTDYDNWLSKDKSKSDLEQLIRSHKAPDFMSHPIKEDFYKNNHIYEQIIDSNDYQNI
jgi:hypothetical protein